MKGDEALDALARAQAISRLVNWYSLLGVGLSAGSVLTSILDLDVVAAFLAGWGLGFSMGAFGLACWGPR